jgi:GntR family transcriptional regulator, transcriptional repressor for pyruvate dehydrogenase complex
MTEFSSLRRGPLVELAVDQLTKLVAAETWPVGERLPAETELATLLGVGRSTVREAVRALVHAGLLSTRQGSGTFVRALAPASGWDERVRRAGILDVYEVRQALETKAAMLAAERRTDDDLMAIEAARAARHTASGGPRDVFVRADLDFHQAVVAATHNAFLIEMYTSFEPVLLEALLALGSETELGRPDVSHAHDLLARAIMAGDPNEALRATEGNLDVTAAALRAAGR